MVEVMVVISPSKGLMPAPSLSGLLHLPLTLQQVSINPHLHQRLLDTYRQAWFNLLWGHHAPSFLAPDAHKGLFVPSKNLFPQSCGGS